MHPGQAPARTAAQEGGPALDSAPDPPPVTPLRPEAKSTAASAARVLAAVPASWLRALVLPLIILAWLAVILVAGWLLSFVTRTILLVVLSVVLAFAVTPLARRLARWMPPPLALGLAYLVGIAVLLGGGAFLVGTTAAQVSSLVSSLPDYAQQAQILEPRIVGALAPLGVTSSSLVDLQQQAVAQVQTIGTVVARDLLSRLTAFLGTLVDLILVVILSVYLAANGEKISRWLRTETPPGSIRYRSRLLVAIVSRVVGGYIRGVLMLALLIGVLVGVGLLVLGVPYAVLLGVLAFFMEFVPVLGVLISGAAAVLIAVIHFQEPIRPLIVLAYFAVVHVIEGDLVGPRIMGNAVGIHPATGLIALVAGTELFGVWGALFAAPLAGLLQAVVTAAWLEFRGGDAQTVLAAVADAAATETAEKVGAG